MLSIIPRIFFASDEKRSQLRSFISDLRQYKDRKNFFIECILSVAFVSPFFLLKKYYGKDKKFSLKKYYAQKGYFLLFKELAGLFGTGVTLAGGLNYFNYSSEVDSRDEDNAKKLFRIIISRQMGEDEKEDNEEIDVDSFSVWSTA